MDRFQETDAVGWAKARLRRAHHKESKRPITRIGFGGHGAKSAFAHPTESGEHHAVMRSVFVVWEEPNWPVRGADPLAKPNGRLRVRD